MKQFYQWRWKVEEFHKAWKSGCGGEALRMPFADNLRRTLQIMAFVGVYSLLAPDIYVWDDQKFKTEILPSATSG
ncbi:MAG TPA: hypothetical protein ENH10_03110 [Bacteroidetes bacterium]|nr:hypothetical protein [Bacteroidota bacterium]HEX04131.1 hypothetical protein [Bacteroidota bacterium]